LQDYKGEDILLLDDLRDTTFDYTDLLKILDNHTKSTSRSRYHNKAFVGDTIIITSTQPLENWYFDDTVECKQQLKRRLSLQYQFTDDTISEFSYEDKLKKYIFIAEYPNNVKKDIIPGTIRESIAKEMSMKASKTSSDFGLFQL